MNFLIEADYIDSVVDKSDSFMKRVRVYFKNGKELSIIKGKYSAGGDEGLFEIGPINANGEFDRSLFDDNDKDDDTLGYCNVDKVNYYIQKIGQMK